MHPQSSLPDLHLVLIAQDHPLPKWCEKTASRPSNHDRHGLVVTDEHQPLIQRHDKLARTRLTEYGAASRIQRQTVAPARLRHAPDESRFL